MADGTGKKLYENGGRDLSAEGWEEMAKRTDEVAKATRKVAKALKEHGRGTAGFLLAKAEWLVAFAKLGSAVGT